MMLGEVVLRREHSERLLLALAAGTCQPEPAACFQRLCVLTKDTGFSQFIAGFVVGSMAQLWPDDEFVPIYSGYLKLLKNKAAVYPINYK